MPSRSSLLQIPSLRDVVRVEALVRHLQRREKKSVHLLPTTTQRGVSVRPAADRDETQSRQVTTTTVGKPRSVTLAKKLSRLASHHVATTPTTITVQSPSVNSGAATEPPPWPAEIERAIAVQVRKLAVIDRRGMTSARERENGYSGGLLHHDAAAEYAASTAILSDTQRLFEAFGMVGHVTPPNVVPGFQAIFRQHWSDFFVTEISNEREEEPQPLSRISDFSVPPLPWNLLAATTPVASPTPVAAERLFDTGESLRRHLNDVVMPQFRKKSRASLSRTVEASSSSGKIHAEEEGNRPTSVADLHLQCYLHKQHLAHSAALSIVAQVLRVHPGAISVAGIKDLVGDTIQRIRIRGVSPESLLLLNQHIRTAKPWIRLTCSNFSYHAEPLLVGELWGNAFRVILRDVDASATAESVTDAVEALQQRGFPNFYGCQRFSWFGGAQDVAFTLLHHNWLAFAFRLLNYTDTPRSLRELLQRRKKYPNHMQDEYRRNVVRRLRSLSIEPTDLDAPLFAAPPSLTSGDGINRDVQGLPPKHQLILRCLRSAFFDLSLASRRLTAQRLSSFFWNVVLSLRLAYFGPEEVLVGDMVFPQHVRNMPWRVRGNHYSEHVMYVTEENRHQFTILDVVHPAFEFDSSPLPRNAVGSFYRLVCDTFGVDWDFRHRAKGLVDFCDAPRPIIRRPERLVHRFDAASRVLELEFWLERGCYANVALTELMKADRCVGSEAIVKLPALDPQWERGDEDPGYVTALQDVYEDFEDGQGFVRDSVESLVSQSGTRTRAVVPVVDDSSKPDAASLFEWMEAYRELHGGEEPQLFKPESEDPARRAAAWSSHNLLRNSERRDADAAEMAKKLLGDELGRQRLEGLGVALTSASRLTVQEEYAGHHIPMRPNVSAKRVFFQVQRRARRFRGAPKFVPRVRLGAQVSSAAAKRASFRTLNKGTWNVTW